MTCQKVNLWTNIPKVVTLVSLLSTPPVFAQKASSLQPSLTEINKTPSFFPNTTPNTTPNNTPTPPPRVNPTPSPNVNTNPIPIQPTTFSPSINVPQNQVSPPQVRNNIPSQREINQMVMDLENLIHRVETTLITAEARQFKQGESMTAVADYVLKNPSNNLKSENKNVIRYSNSSAFEAIANAREVVKNFPNLALQDYAQARQVWMDARRSLWDSYPVDRPLTQPEVRAMWVDRGTIVKARSKNDLKPLFDRMAQAGINTIFFETVNSSYTIYPSRVAPEQNPLTRGWDPLQASIELAHERGMELHAWAWVFAAANQGHNRILGQPEDYLGPVLSRNPSWVLKDRNGKVFNRTPGFKKAFLDPANPQVRSYLMALFEEIATNYKVDGIQLDYIRYPFQDSMTKQTFGYTDASRGLFKEIYGVDPVNIKPSSPAWQQWTSFRIKQVSSFVTDVSRTLKSKRPDLVISAAVFPMERSERLRVLQQHWEDWIYNQSVDLMVLMTYALDTGSFEDRLNSLYEFSQKNPSLIIPGIRLLSVPNTEAFDQIQLIRNLPSSGYALFASENFNPQLGKIFEQTQAKIEEEKEPLPYRKPFDSALSRYQALQQEWNFMLVHQQINIDSANLKSWTQQADKLKHTLRQLRENPNAQNLRMAQTELANLQLKLPRYLSKHKQKNPLQIQTWNNRLITLNNLLQYGERTLLSN